MKVGAHLTAEMQTNIVDFLRMNASTFAWTTAYIKGIDPAIISHKLNVDPTYKTIRQKSRKLGSERLKAVNDEVERLLAAGSITNVKYPEWLANPVVVKKKNGKWRVCIDFTDLNKACLKDSYPLPHIDWLVESTTRNEILTFMDAFSGYNQILMHPEDREKPTFITDRGTYCYKVMPFGLKNAGATYQRLVMLGEFLGYIMTERGIEANPKQISAILDIPSPKNGKEVQRLTGRIAALNRFISRSTDKCLPFYELLKKTNHSGRLSKWAFELSEHDITYNNRTATDFLVELTPELQQDLALPSPNWVLHVDGSLTVKGSWAGVQLQSPTVQNLAKEFEFFELIKVPRGENVCANSLAALGSKLRDQVNRTIPIHRIEAPRINLSKEKIFAVAPVTETQSEEPSVDDQPTLDWRTKFFDYLTNNNLPPRKWAARRLKARSTKYVVIDGNLHRWTATKVLLRCIMGDETRLIMAEPHEGAAGNHSRGRALALKIRNIGFFWPTMNTDCESYARHCDMCQRHAPKIHRPTECQIRLSPSTPRYPQENGQAESSNKIIIDGIKKQLDLKKGLWPDELDGVLWSHRTTPRGSTKTTPFSLAYGIKAMAPAEVNVTSLRRSKMPHLESLNSNMLLDALDQIEERRDQALLRIQNYQNQIESYYNKSVKSRPLNLGDLVLRKVFENTEELKAGKLDINWEGPYEITQVVQPGVYRLETSTGEAVPRAWNAKNLKKYYLKE
ncbi:hypothetical protein N665_0652s0002 [Sinapis alba]|nr:hypothetical protein N665_0652s0002 [Sinapis alba]